MNQPYAELLERRVLLAATASAHSILRAGSIDPQFHPPAIGAEDGETLIEQNGVTLFTPEWSTGTAITAQLPDGTPDTLLDQTIAASLPVGFEPAGAQIESNDQLVIIGTIKLSTEVLRLNSDGTLDTTFGVNGVATVPTTFSEYDNDDWQFGFEPDGAIIVLDNAQLVRLTSAGAIDTSFGGGGSVEFADAARPLWNAALNVQPDGKVLVIGIVSPQTSVTEAAVLRFKDDGTPDLSFGDDGEATITSSQTKLTLNILGQAVAPSGQIDLYLQTSLDGVWDSRTNVVQLNSNGTLNRKFGNKGIANAALMSGGTSLVGSMVVDGSGNIIVASIQQVGVPNGGGVGFPIRYATDYAGVVRLTPTGHRDPAFARDGVRVLGSERVDLTILDIADWLYAPNGDIIVESQILGQPYALLDKPVRT